MLGLGLVGLLIGLSIVPFTGSAPAGADSSSASYTATKTLTRSNLNADGTSDLVDSRTVTVNVDQTQDLRGRQDVTVSWTGAHPTGGITGQYNTTGAPNQEYPVAIFECRDTSGAGTATPDVDPTTCFTHGWASRFQQDYDTGFGPWRVDRYATVADRAAVVGQPNPEPTACVGLDAPAEYWVPFDAVDGTSYPYGPDSGCGGIPPEDYAIDQTSASIPINATYADTGVDGTGSDSFDISTSAENASLGCSDTVACSLVVIPIMGISCDPNANGLPAEDVPPAGELAQIQSNCEATGAYAPGELASSGQQAELAVSGYLWWSASNWRNRFVVPLSFAPPADICSQQSSGQPLDVYGSELMTEAAIQWEPAFCLNPKLFDFNHVQTGEQLARTLVSNGSVEAAFSAQAPPGGTSGFGTPTVQAPVAVTGFSISYRIDNAQGQTVTNLRLNARLLAKLLTESYTQSPQISDQYTALSHNPESITADPEFKALNPDIPINYGDPAAAALLAVSGNSDVMYALTAYINADPEARAWLDGQPDPWGMIVNPNYKDISLPVESWPLLDTFIPNLPSQTCLTAAPIPWLPSVASPVATLATATLDAQFALDWPKIQCNTFDGPDGLVSQWAAGSLQPVGQRFVIALTTLGEASRYGLPSASLETQSSVSPTAQFTDGTGRTFVAPTQTALQSAASALVQDPDAGTWTLPYDTLNTDADLAGAYPGLMVVYADVPTTGLPTTDAADYANLLRFAATNGQQSGYGNGQLPPGYLPMSSENGLEALVDYTLAAADDVQAQAGAVPGVVATPTPTPTDDGDDGGSLAFTAPTVAASTASVATAAPSASASASPTSSALPPAEAAAVARARTAAVTSSLGGLALPFVIGIAVLGALMAVSGQVRPGTIGRRR